MHEFILPDEYEVVGKHGAIFEELRSMFGKVPNIFLTFISSENGLESYFSYLMQKNSLTYREREVDNLVVSQVNECAYCLSFHSAVAEGLGFTKDQIVEIRKNNITFDEKLRAICALAERIAVTKGHIVGPYLVDFYNAGYDQGHLVDVILAVGSISTLNLL